MKLLLRAMAVLAGLALLAALGLLAYQLLGSGENTRARNLGRGADSAQQQPAEAALPVRSVPVRRGAVQEELRQNATLVSSRVTPVFSPIAGIVQAVEAEEGAALRAGQVLIRLDDREWRLNLEQARVTLAKSQVDWERQQAMRAGSLEERREFREARHTFQTRQVGLERKTVERRKKETEARRVALAYAEKLASLKERDDAAYEADRARLEESEARIELRRAREEWTRVQALEERRLIDDQAYNEARFAYQSAKAAVDLAALKVTQSRIVSPVDAVLTERKVEVGDYISSNTRLMTLADLQRLEAVLRLPEAMWTRIQAGLTVRVIPEMLPGVEVAGRVHRVSPVIDSESGTFKVTVAVETPPGGKVRPGMFAALGIQLTARAQALLIPRQAVLGDEDSRFVYLAAGGRAERRRIVLGAVSGDDVEVLDGLAEGERVVVAGQHGLLPGRLVRELE